MAAARAGKHAVTAAGQDVPAGTGWQTYAADGLLRDGRSMRVRALRPDDKERLLGLFRRQSPESIHYRFFGAKSTLTEAELRYFTELDFDRHVGLAAVRGSGAEEEFLGVARYIRRDDAPGDGRRAEFAVAVADAEQGRGVGTLLLEHLARIAHRSGVTTFEADVLGDNRKMFEVLEGGGFGARSTSPETVVHVSFGTDERGRSTEVSDERAWRAAAESLRGLLSPRSVAVVGASRKAGSIGAALVENLKQYGFRGPIHVVNPEAREIAGLEVHRTLAEIPGRVDMAVVATPAAAVEGVVAECARIGVRGVVVISAGFAEISPEGRAAQTRMRDVARAAGMRLVGPNCMGVLNTDPAVRMHATFAPLQPTAGNVGFLSQSGALGLAVLDYAQKLNIGLSTFVSVGNKADVSGNDLLAYWREDPRTDVVGLYLESFGNPRRFVRLAPAVARHKPIVAVKAGRTAAGSRAASSHSASLACLDVAVDALFEQAGVIRTETLEDLFDVVTLLATQPVPAGPRVAVVTNAGGPGILLADACEARGLRLPELAPETTDSLRAFLPPTASVRNPVDLIASASAEAFERAVARVGADPNVDALVVIYVPPLAINTEEVAEAIARGAGQVPAGKPVATVFLSSKGAPPAIARGPRGKLPSYSFPENAARALAAAVKYGRWRARPRGTAAALDPAACEKVRRVVERALAGPESARWLDPSDVHAVLDAAGIPFAKATVVPPDQAVPAGEALGYPLVAKAVAPGLLHKSDVGGVILGLDSPAATAEAVQTLCERLARAGKPLLAVELQREVRGGIEALVGVVSDPTFGPLVVCGLGGVQVELLRDASFRMPPVTDLDAAEMIDRLRLKPLLDGYRGAPAGDREALAALVQRVSALVEAVPELREMDLNPVKVLPPGQGAVVVDARIRVGRLTPADLR
jgi:acetyl coenzyme A synthetase (ADP forming)-like protein